MGKYFLYCRVSTDKKKFDKDGKELKNKVQEFERQKLIAERSGLEFEEIFKEKVSGGIKGNQRKEFNRMLQRLDGDSTVVVTESSRLGRNYIDCFEMVDMITQEYNSNIMFLSNNLKVSSNGKLNPYEWFSLAISFVTDEWQKRQIGYNTQNALKAKKEQGVKLGRPQYISKKPIELIWKDHSNGVKNYEISEKYDISKPTVGKIINTVKEILKDYSNGESEQDLAIKYNINDNVIKDVINIKCFYN